MAYDIVKKDLSYHTFSNVYHCVLYMKSLKTHQTKVQLGFLFCVRWRQWVT